MQSSRSRIRRHPTRFLNHGHVKHGPLTQIGIGNGYWPSAGTRPRFCALRIRHGQKTVLFRIAVVSRSRRLLYAISEYGGIANLCSKVDLKIVITTGRHEEELVLEGPITKK